MIGGRFRNRAIRIPYYAVPRPCETEIPPDASRLAEWCIVHGEQMEKMGEEREKVVVLRCHFLRVLKNNDNYD